jgi:hypothetical protein
MPPLSVALLGCAVLGGVLVAGGWLWLRLLGADPRTGRRLAGAREVGVGDLMDLDASPSRPLRVAGRIRCPDPMVTEDGERLVAYHRDVEVRLPNGRWRTIERLRETRSFELWDHAGSLPIDPALAAEPLVTIPQVWQGSPTELQEPHASAVARLAAEGSPPTAARATTRTISIVDRLLVLANATLQRPGVVSLQPPSGGFVISALELDAAMRLLGGRHRRQLPFAIGSVAAGLAVAVIGLLGAITVAILRP